MENKTDKKFTWVIKNFSSLEYDRIYSDEFVIDGCKWKLRAGAKGYANNHYLSLYLCATEDRSLPPGWRRHARYSFTIVNQISRTLSQQRETKDWFDQNRTIQGFQAMFPLNEIRHKDSGFLVNGELKIVAEVDVLEVIEKLDVPEENTSRVIETMDVNGFQVLPSQVKYVKLLFERHPDIASGFNIKNQRLRTHYMNVLLSLLDTVCQLLEETTKDDMLDAYTALESMTNVGFKLDWLENKLDKILEKKQKEEACETRMKELEEELKDLKLKCLDVEALLEKEKAELLVARAPLSHDDIF